MSKKRKIQLGKREKQDHLLVDKPIEKMTL